MGSPSVAEGLFVVVVVCRTIDQGLLVVVGRLAAQGLLVVEDKIAVQNSFLLEALSLYDWLHSVQVAILMHLDVLQAVGRVDHSEQAVHVDQK